MRNRLLLASTAAPRIAAPAIIHSSAYASNLNAIIGDVYAAVDVVSREQVGFIPSVSRDGAVERAAVGQNVNIPDVQIGAAQDITPSMNPTHTGGDITGTAKTMTITHSRMVPINLTGEEARALGNGGGPNALTVRGQAVAKGLRTLTNEVEQTIANAAMVGASRAYGTAGTNPFADSTADLGPLSALRQILNDNGAPKIDRSLVLNSDHAARLIVNRNLTRVNEAGDAMTLRDGELASLLGFSVKETNAPDMTHVAGTAALATTNTAGYAVGSRMITLASAGTGSIKAGDVIQFAGDSNKYVVAVGDADVSGGGTITLAAPGLRKAIGTAATAITLADSSHSSVAFSQNAIHLAARLPAAPPEGDQRIDSMEIFDERSGLVYELAVYPGYRMVRYELGLAWGAKTINDDHVALLLG